MASNYDVAEHIINSWLRKRTDEKDWETLNRCICYGLDGQFMSLMSRIDRLEAELAKKDLTKESD